MFLEKLYEKRKHTDRKENTAGTCMAIVPVLGFLIFGFIPIFLGIAMSFFDFHGKQFFNFNSSKGEITEFVWFDNYKHMFSPGAKASTKENGGWFLEALFTTVIMYLSTPTCIVLSLIIAFFLSKKIKCKTLFRTIYLLPYVCSAVAIALIWGKFFAPTNGIFNRLLMDHFGANPTKYNAYDWVGKHFYMIIFLVHVWCGCGFNIVLFTAALTNVNNSYYEAAQVDGANPFQIFFKITIPSISPTTFYLFITGTIGALQAFAVPDMVGEFSSARAGTVMGMYINDKALTVVGYIEYLINEATPSHPGVASAIALMLSLIIGLVTIINFIGSRYWVSYD